MDTSPRRLVERFYHEVWNQRDETVAREILHPHFRFRGSLGPVLTGPDGFIAYLFRVHAALAGYTCEIEDLIESGPRVAARMRFGGVHRGTFFGVPATGKRVSWAGAAFFTTERDSTERGQITELWVLGDVDAIKQQLGLSCVTGL